MLPSGCCVVNFELEPKLWVPGILAFWVLGLRALTSVLIKSLGSLIGKLKWLFVVILVIGSACHWCRSAEMTG
jgi:hypothetical protein